MAKRASKWVKANKKYPNEEFDWYPYNKLEEHLKQYLDILSALVSNPLEYPPDYTSAGGNSFYHIDLIQELFSKKYPDSPIDNNIRSRVLLRLATYGWVIMTKEKYHTLTMRAKRFFIENPNIYNECKMSQKVS